MPPIQTSYDDRMPVAQAGMIADTSLRQIDGCTAATAPISIARAVVFVDGDNSTSPVKQIESADLTALAGKHVGISVHSHFAAVTGRYELGDAVNVMRIGRIWAYSNLTGGAKPTRGQPVSLVTRADGGTNVANTGGTAIPGWSFTGAVGVNKFDGRPIAEVELTIQPITAPAA